jgi:mRNA interferase MazF
MAIIFVPDPGDVLMCDFSTGFKPPEMVKVRRVVVLSPRNRARIPGTYIVVPISKTTPAPPEGCHCEFKPRSYDFFDPVESVWAKADMVVSVAAHRLDRVRLNGRYMRVQIRKADLQRVKTSILHALGMEAWREVEDSAKTVMEAKPLKISEIKMSLDSVGAKE